MPSYRDRYNPEAVRYPADFRPKILICLALLTNLICGLAVIVSPGSVLYNCFAAVVLISTTALYIHLWPTTLVTDQTGLHGLWLLGRRRQFIGWNDVGALSEESELGMDWAVKLRVRVDQLVVSNRDGTVRIAHTPRHPDRQRMLKEFHLHGVKLEVEAASHAAPGV